MLTIAEFTLSAPDQRRFVPSIGSILQGVLMERLDANLAASLHVPGLRPYSQYCYYQGDKLIWRLAALTAAAKAAIIEPLLTEGFNHITLRDKAVTLTVEQKTLLREYNYQQFADHFFLTDKPARQLTLRFLTPASFRSANNYMIFPSIEHVLQSLYNRWNSFAGRFALTDPEVLEHMASHLAISGYQLSTTRFSLENVNIPAFQGELRLSVKGPDALCRLISLLLAYSEFAGIGIKTAIGMGASTIFAYQQGRTSSLLP